ncbi:GNAT family N-acetyltransferase [Saccharopolyspora erythraea]|uniref:GNAT family N-acetyltransferase n=1 Tax=Saccharopolyspora erythraea TaxID=1836 RepID=UPI001BA5BCB6|nr:GNAT family N-acetyltransferase [Saccharopolyspora erythraea]QUH04262.1 GNAT family N-acetyltransferase [Saccharopolyspora erythraea]
MGISPAVGGQRRITATPVDDPVSAVVLRTYIDELASRYYGRQATAEEIDRALAEDPSDDLRPPHGAFLVAWDGDSSVGCVGVRLLSAEVAEIKRMYVAPRVRGRGWGGRLLGAAEEHARSIGASLLRLDTRADLVEARGLYAKHGFAEIPAYARRKYADHWFEKRIAAEHV